MKELELMYEGKAKKVFKTDDEDLLIVAYKDDATAFNGLKKGTIVGKGIVNNRMSNYLCKILEEKGIPTHYVEELDERRTVVKKVEIVPLEVIIRNKAAGSFSKRLGVAEGTELKCSTLEFSYKNDDLGDPLINSYMALALGLATKSHYVTSKDKIEHAAETINEELKEIFKNIGIELIDFKLEFGRYHGEIILADEISPDTCRYWDIETHDHLDKDRFRRDLGDAEGAYQEVYRRLGLDK